MMKKRVLALVLFLIFGLSLCSAEDKGFNTKLEMQNYCESILNKIKGYKIKEGFELIRSEWIASESELDSFELQTIKQLDLVKGRFGKPVDFKFIKLEEAADVSVRYTYVIRYEKHLTRWLFVFYNPSNKWFLNSFKWDDTIEKLFIE